MTKFCQISLILILSYSFFSCNEEPKSSPENAEPVPEAESKISGSLDDLKSRALSEDDIFGRVNQSLGVLQKEFQISSTLNKELGKTTVFVDERFTMLIRNEKDGKVTDTKVNLKNLNPENGGMRLLPDVEAGDLPGFSVQVIEGLEGVEVIENEKTVIEDQRELKIYMASRENVQNVLPAFVQALHVVHGKN